MSEKEEKIYFSAEQDIFFVSLKNKFMQAAGAYAAEHSLDRKQPTGSAIVKTGEIIGLGANGSDVHEKYGCERVRRGIPTGQQYELCEGCHPKNHSEPRAIADALRNNKDTKDADLYLWGHWWCCRWCREEMKRVGIKNVFFVKGSEILFNRNNRKNILPKM